MSHTTGNSDLCQPCGLYPFERNRYFDGKLLVTRDFQQEQAYLRGKDRLHNSLLHGYGTVCGLKISQHPNPACQYKFVILQPGLALDCCGNEIVVPEQQVINLLEKIDQVTAGTEATNPTLYIRLAYQECDTELVPALLDDCGCSDTNTEYNRSRETYRLFVDLETPASAATEPLDARLEWQHTLSVAEPNAIEVDRQLQRLYVAEYLSAGEATGGWLRTFDTHNHRLITRVAISSGFAPTAMTRSNFGDRIYVADYRPGEGESAAQAQIKIFVRTDLEQNPDAASVTLRVLENERIVDLDTSNGDNSLYALTEQGRMLHWSNEAIQQKMDNPEADVPFTEHLLGDRLSQLPDPPASSTLLPVRMSQSPDGQFMVIADAQVPRLIVLFLPQFDPLALADPSTLTPDRLNGFIKPFALPEGDIPTALTINYLGNALYVLCQSKKLYRLAIDARQELATYLPLVPDESDLISLLDLAAADTSDLQTNPLDLGVSPRDNWVYVLRRLSQVEQPLDRGDLLIIPIENAELQPSRNAPVDVEGDARFLNLAFLGQRLYVAGLSPADPSDGSVSVLYVDETTCDNFIRQEIEGGCQTCADPSQGVIIASIENYQRNQPIVEQRTDETDNLIDNFTYRQLLPSTNTLRRVIECMLQKGISEGIPGPPGQRGPEGARGAPGPSITEVAVQTLSPGSAATASLSEIEGDPEGDRRLSLGIPQGIPGPQGVRGPGITAVTITPLAPGSTPTATLQPIPNDPEADQRLLLGLPTNSQEFTRITNASFHHDEVLAIEEFVNLFGEKGVFGRVGLVVQFGAEVRLDSLHRRSVFVLINRPNRQEDLITDCDCIFPTQIQPVRVTGVGERKVAWVVGDAEPQQVLQSGPNTSFDLVTGADTLAGGAAPSAVRIILSQAIPRTTRRLQVVIRGDLVVDLKGRALDGNHLWPGVPASRPGETIPNFDIAGRNSGNGTEGGDWISIIHLSDVAR